MLLRFVGDEPDRLYPSVVVTVDADGAPATVAPYTLNSGDVIDVAVDPGDGRFAALTGKAAKTVDVLLPDNHPDRDRTVAEEAPDPVEPVEPVEPVTEPAPPEPAPAVVAAADVTPTTDAQKGQ